MGPRKGTESNRQADRPNVSNHTFMRYKNNYVTTHSLIQQRRNRQIFVFWHWRSKSDDELPVLSVALTANHTKQSVTHDRSRQLFLLTGVPQGSLAQVAFQSMSKFRTHLKRLCDWLERLVTGGSFAAATLCACKHEMHICCRRTQEY